MPVRIFFFAALTVLMMSCASFKQDVMFRADEEFTPDPIKAEALRADRNYIIQKNDFLQFEIFSNHGEKLIDPHPELSQMDPGSGTLQNEPQYLVDLNGLVKLPLIGELKLEGLTLRQAEQVVQKEYEQYYKSPFVIIKFSNKRVVVLGAPGGQVIPLMNENVTLAEVLALAKGINVGGKAKTIKVLRGEKVFVIDFTTIEGYKSSNMIIEPGDIVYIEPVRRPFAEGINEYSVLLTFVVSLTTLAVLISRLQ